MLVKAPCCPSSDVEATGSGGGQPGARCAVRSQKLLQSWSSACRLSWEPPHTSAAACGAVSSGSGCLPGCRGVPRCRQGQGCELS
jgi:hypothetical protein